MCTASCEAWPPFFPRTSKGDLSQGQISQWNCVQIIGGRTSLQRPLQKPANHYHSCVASPRLDFPVSWRHVQCSGGPRTLFGYEVAEKAESSLRPLRCLDHSLNLGRTSHSVFHQRSWSSAQVIHYLTSLPSLRLLPCVNSRLPHPNRLP